MISRNRLIETELIKQRTLIVVLTSHHRPSPTKLCRQKTESLFAKTSKSLLQQNRHIADKTAAPAFVGYWTNIGQRSALALNGSLAIDPTATLAVHCGNGFDAGFSPYQSTRLSRYNAGSLAWGGRHATARVHYAYRLSASRQRNDCGVTKYIGSCRSYWRGFKRYRTYGKVPRRHRRPGARPGLLASRAGPTSGSY